MMIIPGIVVVWIRFVFTTTKVAATAATTTAITSAYDTTNYETCLWNTKKNRSNFMDVLLQRHNIRRKFVFVCFVYLTSRRSDNEIGIHILFSKLFGNIQSQRTVAIVDIPLCLVT